MHSMCMATKTISLNLPAYERLRRARRFSNESFSQVVLRAAWPGDTVTGAELLAMQQNAAPTFTEDELAAVEAAKSMDQLPVDKWR